MLPSHKNDSSTSTSRPTSNVNLDADKNLVPVSVRNGDILVKPVGVECIAPFEVKTGDNFNYYIFLKDTSDGGKNDISFYVEAGKTVEIDVPLGRYNLYYATGDTWYGLENKFGSKTSYYEAPFTSLDFYTTGDKVSGYTITLYSVAGGNMHTSKIDESSFPG